MACSIPDIGDTNDCRRIVHFNRQPDCWWKMVGLLPSSFLGKMLVLSSLCPGGSAQSGFDR